MNLKKEIKKIYAYPSPDEKNFQKAIFQKREFHNYLIPYRPKLDNYEDIQKYRSNKCEGEFKLRKQQALLTNFISPNTPYKGLLIMHGTGTGKTCTAIAIAEQFKNIVKKYNTKIYILTFGPNGRETFKNELLFCTGNTYVKNNELVDQMTVEEKTRENKIGLYSVLQYYKILSYKTFHKKVLGEKIIEKQVFNKNQKKSKYRKNKDGDFEREIVIDRIHNMNNTILIVDEAHNLTGNDQGLALKKIIKQSENLRVILLSATPMKNLADDIIDILNFVRPSDKPIIRDKIFTNEKNFEMQFKPNGIKYLKKYATGYVSFFRGNIPYTFAERINKGEIPNELLFTPVIKCFMEKFQLEIYNKTLQIKEDTLDRKSSSASLFVFPILSKDQKNIIGTYGTDGYNIISSQLNSTAVTLLRTKINKKFFNNKIKSNKLKDIIYMNSKKNISGLILKKKYLKHFSIKYYTALNNLSELYNGKKGVCTAFIYCNLVKVGIELFSEILLQNGYLEYTENPKDYNIQDDTIDALTGKPYSEFKNKEIFNPATFILITGSTDDGVDDIPEIKQKIIRNVFNNPSNKDGHKLKLILGSKVMNEGVTLENTKEVHILDVHYNLGKIEQVIGRAIRECKHQQVITDKYKFPIVNVYRYVASVKNKLSSDENLYKKAERKYLLVKKVERALKEVAIDCPLLIHGNMFPEELEKYKDCYYPTLENKRKGRKICPALCDFQECKIKCNDDSLNKNFYNKKTLGYNYLTKNEIDFNTFNSNLAKFEINSTKQKIKDLYRFEHVYTYDKLYNIIIKSFHKNQKDLFIPYFLDQALEELIPITENDFNNFKDTIYDKYGQPGYLILRNNYYIFQPFNQNEDVPMYYRINPNIILTNNVNLKNFITKNYTIVENKNIENKNIENKRTLKKSYNFENTMNYYNSRDENDIIGIIDKNLNKYTLDESDLFKIRKKRMKFLDKKRGTGIPTLKGAVCTSKEKNYLISILKYIPNIKSKESNIVQKTRQKICVYIKNKLLYAEKYSTSENKNKKTYMMIPFDHPFYKFPYNLEDRVKDTLKKLKTLIKTNISFKTHKLKGGIFNKERSDKYVFYNIIVQNTNNLKKYSTEIKKLGGILNKKEWIFVIE